MLCIIKSFGIRTHLIQLRDKSATYYDIFSTNHQGSYSTWPSNSEIGHQIWEIAKGF